MKPNDMYIQILGRRKIIRFCLQEGFPKKDRGGKEKVHFHVNLYWF